MESCTTASHHHRPGWTSIEASKRGITAAVAASVSDSRRVTVPPSPGEKHTHLHRNATPGFERQTEKTRVLPKLAMEASGMMAAMKRGPG